MIGRTLIFVSHASADIKMVRQVRNYLEERDTIPLLFHLVALTNAEEFWPLIEREILARNFFLYCESEAAERSQWVQRERHAVELARQTLAKSPSLAEQRKSTAEAAIDAGLRSVEEGALPFGPFERSCLFHAVNNLHSGHYELAKLQALAVVSVGDGRSTTDPIQPPPAETVEELRHRFLEIRSRPACEFSRIF